MRASRSRSNWFIPATDAIGSTALLDIVQVAALGGAAAAVDAVAGGTPKVASAGRQPAQEAYSKQLEVSLRGRPSSASTQFFGNKQVARVRALQLTKACTTCGSCGYETSLVRRQTK
jgi:hypothetical protein